MQLGERSSESHPHRRAAAVLFVLAWVFWLLRWGPALLVVAFVAWVILHHRIEAGLGKTLRHHWQRAWPPKLPLLIPLLVASALTFGLYDAPTTAKVLPVALDVFALSMIVFGKWWTRFTLPRWLGGDGPSPVLSSGPLARSAWTRSR